MITHNNEVLGVFDDTTDEDRAHKAFALQFGSLYLYDASYDMDLEGKKLPENIRQFFQFLAVYLWGIRIKELSSGTGVPQARRINAKVKVLHDLVKKTKKKE